MPDNRHVASRALDACETGSAISVSDDAGIAAGSSNGGTVGACMSCVDTAWCAQCAWHNAGECSACAIGISSQCMAMAVLPTGRSAREQA